MLKTLFVGAAVIATLAGATQADATRRGRLGGGVTGAVGGALVAGPVGAVVGGVGGVIVGDHVSNRAAHRRGYWRRHHHIHR
ncbi:hypothetical protein BH09PSE2_BH09PSE2_21240 [soil metagenome]